MKIALIHGQTHKGSSYNMGRLIADKIKGEKEISEFFLPRDLDRFCLGCYRCLEGDENCPFYEEKSRITRAMEEADVLIFTTPTYCMHASAPMKSLLDLTFTYWMVHRPRKCMFEKRAAIVTAAAGSGMRGAIKDIKTALFYWGVPSIKTYGAAVSAMSWETVSEKKRRKAEKAAERIARSLSSQGKPHVGIKTRLYFKMMGMMQKGGMGASPCEKEYWQDNGWFGKDRPWKD